MTNVTRSLLAGAALCAGAALVTANSVSAYAADLGRGSLKDYGAPAPMPVAYASPSSWYIRGDIGVGSYDVPNIYEQDGTAEYDLTRNKIGRNWMAGGGIGRYLGANTRADITIDWLRKSEVSGVMTQINYVDDPLAAPHCSNGGVALACASNLAGTHKFDLQSTVGLLNFYYDFGHRGHFSPYVGAGLGFVRHTTSGGVLVDDQANGISGTIDSKTTTQLAGAVMAGFTVAMRNDLHLDAGYRFLYMGQAETGAVKGTITNQYNTTDPVKGLNYNDPTVTDIHAHQFRLGVRYDFGGGSTCGPRC